MDRPNNRAKVGALNDAFRKTFVGGQVVMTIGVNALSKELLTEVIGKVRAFGTFTADNDPNNEHDFGSFDVGGDKFFWKIDYYDTLLEFGSPDPSDPAVTKRVLTIMRADEY